MLSLIVLQNVRSLHHTDIDHMGKKWSLNQFAQFGIIQCCFIYNIMLTELRQ